MVLHRNSCPSRAPTRPFGLTGNIASTCKRVAHGSGFELFELQGESWTLRPLFDQQVLCRSGCNDSWFWMDSTWFKGFEQRSWHVLTLLKWINRDEGRTSWVIRKERVHDPHGLDRRRSTRHAEDGNEARRNDVRPADLRCETTRKHERPDLIIHMLIVCVYSCIYLHVYVVITYQLYSLCIECTQKRSKEHYWMVLIHV